MSNVSSKSPVASLNAVHSSKGAGGASWGPAAAIIVSVLAFAGGFILAGLLAYLLAGLLGKSAHETSAWLDSVTGQFVFIVLAESAVIAAVVWFLHHRKVSIQALGYHRPPTLPDAGRAILGFVVYFVALIVATIIANRLFHIDITQKQELGFDNVFSTTERIMTFASLVILPPVAEETLFRGFLYTGVRSRLSFVWTLLFVSLVFASLHLLESSQGLLWIAGIDTFILSVVLCYLREKTGNLWAGIFLHMFKNGLAFTLLYVVGTR